MDSTLAGPFFEAGSFRDRGGRVFTHNGQIFRALNEEAATEWAAAGSRPFIQDAMRDGTIVRTESAPHMKPFAVENGFSSVISHERIPLVSWPYEWSFGMLREAALLQLDLMLRSVTDGFILKDASAFNIQFRGTQPVLIDTGSIVSLQPGRTWDGYRQFCQMFLFPLMLQAWKGVDFQPWLRGSINGISPQQFCSLLSLRDLFRTGAMTHVWLHSRLQRQDASQVRVSDSLNDSGFSRKMIQNNVVGLLKTVKRLRWNVPSSTWSAYDQSAEPVLRDSSGKEIFVERICSTQRWKTVWDLGCNQGRYSRIAAKHSDLVVALDSDHLTVDRLFQSLHQEKNTTIVPLVCDLSDPTPSLGWRCAERQSLEGRSKPDLVLCLALIHHLVIGSNLLLPDVVDWLASLEAMIVIEFVDRSDSQVKQLLANRRDVFSDYTREIFRQQIHRHFILIDEHTLPSGTRTLFLLQPRSARLCSEQIDVGSQPGDAARLAVS